MTSVVLAAIVFGGVSYLSWTCIGGCRLLHEGRRSMLTAALFGCLVGVMLLELTFPLVFAGTSALLAWSDASAGAAHDVRGMLALTWLPLCGAIAAYGTARLFGIRDAVLGAVVLGASYWLLASAAADDTLAPLTAPWSPALALTFLGAAIAAAGIGVTSARGAVDRVAGAPPPIRGRFGLRDVAVLIPAHDEEHSLPICLDAVTALLPRQHVFVGSDGSTDDTVRIAREWRVNVLDIQPNGGKAQALQRLIDHFQICERFELVLIIDADAQPDPEYLDHALPLFDDPEVVAVAGHAIPRWCRHWIPRWSMFFAAYRTRLYRVLQALLRYGQTWRHANVTYIVPGFSSMYRTCVLPHLDLAAPGLAVEDFNMTFAIHRHRLGRIAYTPQARSISQEAYWFRDYCKQVSRWYLGFWQTIRHHGVWVSGFWLSLGLLILEMLVQSIVLLALPLLAIWFATQGAPLALGGYELTALDVIIGVFVADYVFTVIVAVADKKPQLLLYGLGFIVLRWVDSVLFLVALPRAFLSTSDGRWTSPRRI